MRGNSKFYFEICYQVAKNDLISVRFTKRINCIIIKQGVVFLACNTRLRKTTIAIDFCFDAENFFWDLLIAAQIIGKNLLSLGFASKIDIKKRCSQNKNTGFDSKKFKLLGVVVTNFSLKLFHVFIFSFLIFFSCFGLLCSLFCFRGPIVKLLVFFFVSLYS